MTDVHEKDATCLQALTRFTNMIDVDEPGNPYGDTERPWGIGKELHNMCDSLRSSLCCKLKLAAACLFPRISHHPLAALAFFWA